MTGVLPPCAATCSPGSPHTAHSPMWGGKPAGASAAQQEEGKGAASPVAAAAAALDISADLAAVYDALLLVDLLLAQVKRGEQAA